MTVTDAGILRALTKTLKDGITLTDAGITRALTRIFSDSLSLSENFAKTWSTFKTFTESITVTDNLHKFKAPTNTQFATDFATIISEAAETVTLRIPSTTTDPSGRATALSETSISIDAYFTSQSLEKRKPLSGGVDVDGTLIGYFEPTYSSGGNDYEIGLGDVIERNSITYKITEIVGRYNVGSTVVFIKAIMRRDN